LRLVELGLQILEPRAVLVAGAGIGSVVDRPAEGPDGELAPREGCRPGRRRPPPQPADVGAPSPSAEQHREVARALAILQAELPAVEGDGPDLSFAPEGVRSRALGRRDLGFARARGAETRDLGRDVIELELGRAPLGVVEQSRDALV